MVIGDEDTQSGSLRGRDGAHRGYSAVAGDDQPHLLPEGGGHSGSSKVIAIAHSVRHEGKHVGASAPKRAGEHCGGRLTVHVVVAMHQDAVAGIHCGGNERDRLVHPGQREGRRQIRQRRAEKVAGRLGVAESALGQQRRERVGNAQLGSERGHGRLRGRRGNVPAEKRRGADDSRHLRLILLFR